MSGTNWIPSSPLAGDSSFITLLKETSDLALEAGEHQFGERLSGIANILGWIFSHRETEMSVVLLLAAVSERPINSLAHPRAAWDFYAVRNMKILIDRLPSGDSDIPIIRAAVQKAEESRLSTIDSDSVLRGFFQAFFERDLTFWAKSLQAVDVGPIQRIFQLCEDCARRSGDASAAEAFVLLRQVLSQLRHHSAQTPSPQVAAKNDAGPTKQPIPLTQSESAAELDELQKNLRTLKTEGYIPPIKLLEY